MTRAGRAIRLTQEGSFYLLLLCLPFSKAVVELASVGLLVTWLWQRCDPLTRRDTAWCDPAFRPLAWTLELSRRLRALGCGQPRSVLECSGIGQ